MSNRLLGLLAFACMVSVCCACAGLSCSSSSLKTANATLCSSARACRGKSQFSLSMARNGSIVECFCLNSIPVGCDSSLDNSTDGKDYSFCEVSAGSVHLPAPSVANEGSNVISVTIDRFFQHPPFRAPDTRLADLFLIARFQPGPNNTCVRQLGVRVILYRDGRCGIRSRVPMPSIDNLNEDNYYYDDGTPLEISFSKDYFLNATFIDFYIKVTREKKMNLPGNTSSILTLSSKLSSGMTRHPLRQGMLPLHKKI